MTNIKVIVFIVVSSVLVTASTSCARKVADDMLHKSAIGSAHADIEKKKEEAYKIYFEGDAGRAEMALMQFMQYLDGLPDRKSYQVARYVGKMYALTRLQFIRAYKYKTPMDFKEAVQAFVIVERLDGSQKIDEVKFAHKLVDMVQIVDGPRVPWANENSISEANETIDRALSATN